MRGIKFDNRGRWIMVRIYKSSLKEYLAEEILREIYAKGSERANLANLQEMNCNYLPMENILRKYAREFQSEVNKKAAMLVLESLSEEKKMMLKMKYGEKKQLVSISLALNISVTQLVKWNQNIIMKVVCFMGFRLMEEDVFCKKKVVGMIELLSKNIEFFSMLSSKFDIRQDWLEELKRRKKNYYSGNNKSRKYGKIKI